MGTTESVPVAEESYAKSGPSPKHSAPAQHNGDSQTPQRRQVQQKQKKRLPPIKRISGLILGMPGTGKHTLLQRLEGTDPFAKDETEKSNIPSSVTLPYICPPKSKSWDRILFQARASRVVDEKADFAMILLNPQHDAKTTKAYVTRVVADTLKFAGYGDGDKSSSSEPVCICVLFNFRDLQKDEPPQEEIQGWIDESLQSMTNSENILLRFIPVCLKNRYGLSVVHSAIYEIYLHRRKADLLAKLKATTAQIEQTKIPKLMPYDAFENSLQETPKPAVENPQRPAPSNDHHEPSSDPAQPQTHPQQNGGDTRRNPQPNTRGQHTTRVDQTGNVPNRPGDRTNLVPRQMHKQQQQQKVPARNVGKLSLEDFLASSDSEDEKKNVRPIATKKTRRFDSSDDDDDFFYDEAGHRRFNHPTAKNDESSDDSSSSSSDEEEDPQPKKSLISTNSKGPATAPKEAVAAQANSRASDKPLPTPATNQASVTKGQGIPPDDPAGKNATFSPQQKGPAVTAGASDTASQDSAPESKSTSDTMPAPESKLQETVEEPSGATADEENPSESKVDDSETRAEAKPKTTTASSSAESSEQSPPIRPAIVTDNDGNDDEIENEAPESAENRGVHSDGSTSKKPQSKEDQNEPPLEPSPQDNEKPGTIGRDKDESPEEDDLPGPPKNKAAPPPSAKPLQQRPSYDDDDSDDEGFIIGVQPQTTDEDDSDDDDGFMIGGPTPAPPPQPKQQPTPTPSAPAPAAPTSSGISSAALAAIAAAQQEAEAMLMQQDMPKPKKKKKKDSEKKDKKKKKKKKDKSDSGSVTP